MAFLLSNFRQKTSFITCRTIPRYIQSCSSQRKQQLYLCTEEKIRLSLYNKIRTNVASLTSLIKVSISDVTHCKHHHWNKEQQQDRSKETAAVWCLLGFSLKQLLGEEEVPEKPEEDSELVIMIKRGIIAFYNGDYDLSESLLHVALRTAQELQNEEGITYIFDVLANLAYQRGHYAAAEKLFKSVLQRHASADGDLYSNVFVAVSLKLAHCFLEQQDWDNAIMGYHYCIAAQTDKVQAASPDEDTQTLWAMSVEQYARLLLKAGRYEPAREHLTNALKVSRDLLGDQHLQTAVLRNDIGSIYCMETKFPEAIAEIKEAISTVERHLEAESISNQDTEENTAPLKVGPIPPKHKVDAWSNLATYNINLGSVQLLSGDRKAALSSCQEGAKLAKLTTDQEVAQEATNCIKAVREAMVQATKVTNRTAQHAV